MTADVEELYDQVEAGLVHLENVCEEQEFVRNQLSHHKQLSVYKMKKEHELQRYRGNNWFNNNISSTVHFTLAYHKLLIDHFIIACYFELKLT